MLKLLSLSLLQDDDLDTEAIAILCEHLEAEAGDSVLELDDDPGDIFVSDPLEKLLELRPVLVEAGGNLFVEFCLLALFRAVFKDSSDLTLKVLALFLRANAAVNERSSFLCAVVGRKTVDLGLRDTALVAVSPDGLDLSLLVPLPERLHADAQSLTGIAGPQVRGRSAVGTLLVSHHGPVAVRSHARCRRRVRTLRVLLEPPSCFYLRDKDRFSYQLPLGFIRFSIDCLNLLRL